MAMEVALAIGVDRLECDLQLAADGTLVLIHDDQVRLPSGERRRVRSLSTADLRAALPGLLTIDELVELVAGRAPLMLDVKRSGYEPEVIAAIARHGLAADSSVSSTYLAVLLRIGRSFPTMRIGLSTGHIATGAPTRVGRRIAVGTMRQALPRILPPLLARVGAAETMLHHHVVTRKLVEALHADGRRVNVWTVDREPAIERALALGVDGIISNRPDLVDQTLALRDAKPPGPAIDR